MPQPQSTPHLHERCCRADKRGPPFHMHWLRRLCMLQNGGYGSGFSVNGPYQATYTGSIVAKVQTFASKVTQVPLDCKTQQVRLP